MPQKKAKNFWDHCYKKNTLHKLAFFRLHRFSEKCPILQTTFCHYPSKTNLPVTANSELLQEIFKLQIFCKISHFPKTNFCHNKLTTNNNSKFWTFTSSCNKRVLKQCHPARKRDIIYLVEFRVPQNVNAPDPGVVDQVFLRCFGQFGRCFRPTFRGVQRYRQHSAETHRHMNFRLFTFFSLKKLKSKS